MTDVSVVQISNPYILERKQRSCLITSIALPKRQRAIVPNEKSSRLASKIPQILYNIDASMLRFSRIDSRRNPRRANAALSYAALLVVLSSISSLASRFLFDFDFINVFF